ncbi:hypothetical protein NIES970_21220 [[Synechococcus] sp. NIES-970]|nr:hypothetical protein NIES970_21220 [[Synechococcus] sp. NIES-970]
MVRWFKRLIRSGIRKSTHIRQEPLNKVSLVILVLIDIFVLINVFQGLDSVGRWPLSPYEQYPCYSVYQAYQSNTDANRDVPWVMDLLGDYPTREVPSVDTVGRLGRVSDQCDRLRDLTPRVRNEQTRVLRQEIETLQTDIQTLDQRIVTLREQYDSTLLEQIAGQDPELSINETTAAQTLSEIETTEAQRAAVTQTFEAKKTELLNQPDVKAYLTALGDRPFFTSLEQDFNRAQFWHANQQFFLQVLFLVPLILIGYFWHQSAVDHQRNTQALLSWHLLLIFCIPLLIKVLEFIQFGNLIALVFDVLVALLGGLVFVSSYLLIFIIPLIGFGLIKLLQRFVFNPKVQAKSRIQKQRCIQCSCRLSQGEIFCPFCGFEQYSACPRCDRPIHKYTEFCRHCGVNLSDSLPS